MSISDTASKNSSGRNPPSDQQVLDILNQVGLAIGVTVDRSDIHAVVAPGDKGDGLLQLLQTSAQQSGIFIKDSEFSSADDAIELIRHGFPVILALQDDVFVVLQGTSGRKIEVAVITDSVASIQISRRELTELLSKKPEPRKLVAKKELECDAISAAPGNGRDHTHTDDHEEVSPLRRFLGLLDFDRRDIWTVILFAFVSGVLALATPLAVESLVNVVSWGIYVQPLIVLGLMLLTCLGLAGVLRVLQTIVVEIIQRRQFVRVVGDLAHRFPRANQASLSGKYPRELANRVFDIMTIQKATAVLLLDGVSIVLTTLIGLVLLAFYHPFLLGFDIVLVLAMTSITWVLGRGAIRTAIRESKTKYKVVHWLQDVLAQPSIFKTGGGEALAIDRANQLTTDYIKERTRQFRVVIRQVVFAVGLQVIASTALLALGGWLVIEGQLTLGQLVASELVVTVVVGAFAKAGKSLEKFYDLMAGIDKVGQLLDLKTDPRHEPGQLAEGPVEAGWTDLVFRSAAHQSRIPAAKIPVGGRVAIVGDDVAGASLLAKTLAGLREPFSGFAQVAGFEALDAATSAEGRLIGYAGGSDVFHGTLRENIDLARSGIGQSRVREVLQQVELAGAVLQLPDGLETPLQTDGYPLTEAQVTRLVLARAMVSKPKLLIIDRLLDRLDSGCASRLWNILAAPDAPWTLVVTTTRQEIAERCESRIAFRNSEGAVS